MKFTQEEFDNIWGRKPLIIIDTSSILDLYRKAPSKSESALKLLKEIPKEQIFIPSQVYQEYDKNKKTVISEEFKKISNVKQDVDNAITKATNSIEKSLYEYKRRDYPSINELEKNIKEQMIGIKQIANEYKDSNQDEVKRNKSMLKNDEVEPFITELKDTGCIGERPSLSFLMGIYEEGEKRFQYKIPPGYKDLNKDNKDTTKREKFGDLIVWKELLKKAANVEKDIVYLTSDKKEWKVDRSGTKFPDELLFDEFKEYSSYELYFWELNDLVVLLSEYEEEDHLLRNIELNKHEILEAITDLKDLFSVIESDELKLTAYLIHSGDLQYCVSNVLEDVEITDHRPPEINEFSIEVIDGRAVIDGNLNLSLSLNITEGFSENYSNDIGAIVEISGNFSLEVEINPEEILKEEIFDENWLNLDTIQTKAGGFEILSYEEEIGEDDPYVFERCIDCGKRPASYFTESGEPVCMNCSKLYSSCPSCGRLFKEPLMDPVCEDCGGVFHD